MCVIVSQVKPAHEFTCVTFETMKTSKYNQTLNVRVTKDVKDNILRVAKLTNKKPSCVTREIIEKAFEV